MGVNLTAFAVSELRARGVVLVAIAILLAAANVVLHGTTTLVEVLVGALLVGGGMYWAVRSRMGWVLDQAGTVRAAVAEPAADTEWRSVYQTVPALVILLLVDLVFSAVASIAGIPLGAGIALLVITSRLRTWEGQNSVRLLHQLTPGPGTWTRWLSGFNPAEYSLCSTAGVSPAMAGASANRI
jgi:hypothetical protein